ncbi:MAG: DUF2007 domain-containing protein [Pyrinomonadaceae bacterium]|nr:DUF2007 domain-containing protein [Sphingobacteriaceae bacterium]
MNEDWIKIFTSGDAFKAELVRQVLIENDIEAVLLNKQGYPYNIGEAEVYVKPDRFDEATVILVQSEL